VRHRVRLSLELLEGRCVPSTVTNLSDSDPGSLRAAIANTPADGTVDFLPGLTGTITLTTGELGINNDLTINGPGAAVLTVSGNQASPVFDITGAFNVSISGLTVADGTNSGFGGGIMNNGTLAVADCTFTGNSANLNGGGIWNAGTLMVAASEFSGNQAGKGGAVFGAYKTSDTTLNDCNIHGNSATFGGGIATQGSQFTLSSCTVNCNTAGGGVFANAGLGTLTVTGCTISNNTGQGIQIASGTNVSITDSTISGNTSAYGAGISNAGDGTAISNCTISGNIASADGGGIDNGDTLTLTNCTISGNSATHDGGGIVTNASSPGGVILTNCTVSGNTAGEGGGIWNNGWPGTVSVGNSIVAGNTAPSSPDVIGPMTSQGHNLIGDGTGSSGLAPSDFIGTSEDPIDPRLGTLHDNGGPTYTMALLSGSLAIDNGDNTLAPGPYDQRGHGFSRIVNGTIDMGAFEVQGPIAPALIVSNTNDSGPGSLRQAILDANSNPGDDVITFLPSLTGTIDLISTLPDLSSNIDITGPGADRLAVQRGVQDIHYVFTVTSGATVAVAGLTVGNVTAPPAFGGAFENLNGGTLAITNCTIASKSGTDGDLANYGTMTVTNSAITGNYGHGSINNVGTMTLENSTVAGNHNGGIYVQGGALTVRDSTIANNYDIICGGIYILVGGATVTVQNTIIALNQAAIPTHPDVFGPFVSLGHNLIGNGTDSTGFTAPGDQVGTSAALLNPQLEPLQNNGGSTETMALLPGSPAINAGDTAASPGPYDQRGLGFPRVVDGFIDIGAFESEVNLTVRNLNDSGAGSLRQAILDANRLAGDHTITFAPGVVGTISLATPLPNLSNNIDLEGPGAGNLTVEPATGIHFGMFDITSGVTVTLAGLTITGGLADSGGGIRNDSGTVTVRQCTVSGGSALNGGGIANFGTLTIDGSTITGNTAQASVVPPHLGDIHGSATPGLGGGIYNAGSMTIVDITVAANTVVGGTGGGIYNPGNLVIHSSTVAGNVARSLVVGLIYIPYIVGSGGGIATGNGSGSACAIHNTIIAQNALESAPNVPAGSGPDVAGSVTSQGHNLIGDGTGSGGFVATDLVGTSAQPIDPRLGPLQDNGGPTLTMALLPYNPAIDGGDNTGAPGPFDQRGPGFPRIVNGVLDIGAFEYQGPFPSPDQKKLQLFVVSLYQTVLLRTPLAIEVAAWVNDLNAGLTRQQIAQAFWESPEHRGIEIDSYYVSCLHRLPNPAERASWVQAMLGGMSEYGVEYLILVSPEYRSAHPTAASFVTGLYADLFGRPLEPAGQGWIAMAELQVPYGRPWVAGAILISPEMIQQQVDSFYWNLLHRPPDRTGEKAWMAVLQGDPNGESAIAEAFLASDEFFARAALGL
jgi:hypothetical protein